MANQQRGQSNAPAVRAAENPPTTAAAAVGKKRKMTLRNLIKLEFKFAIVFRVHRVGKLKGKSLNVYFFNEKYRYV